MKCPECYQAVGPECSKPETMVGIPIGMFHCSGCGIMQVAPLEHINCEECQGTGQVDWPVE